MTNMVVPIEVCELKEWKEWKEFADSGMLWFVNRILHVFHWVIVIDSNGNVHPARTDLLGFSEEVDEMKRSAMLESLKAE